MKCTERACTRPAVARRLCRAHYQAAWKAGNLSGHDKLPPRQRKHDHVCSPEHKHAEAATCFIQHQCRCEPCRVAHNTREARRRKLKAYGRYDTGLVDVAPVREHVLMLGEFGLGYKRVATLAGFKSSTPVRTIMWGRQDPGPRYGEMQKRVKREFDELWDQLPPKDSWRDSLAYSRSVNYAKARRWLPPLAWDDVDNDSEPPVVDGDGGIDEIAVELAMSGDQVRLSPEERRECVRRLHAKRWSDARIAEALHCADRTVLRIRQELGLPAYEQNELRDRGAA